MKEPIYQIRQVVPPEWCSRCDVCCRFPEKDSFLAPYFTREEIIAVSTLSPEGSKITLRPYGEGFICPVFDPATAHCKVYDLRPIDCRLYPFAIMWNIAGKKIILGMDTKCPYVKEFPEDPCLREAAAEIASGIEAEPLLDIFTSNRGLIGPYQDDVIPLMALRRLSDRVIRGHKVSEW